MDSILPGAFYFGTSTRKVALFPAKVNGNSLLCLIICLRQHEWRDDRKGDAKVRGEKSKRVTGSRKEPNFIGTRDKGESNYRKESTRCKLNIIDERHIVL